LSLDKSTHYILLSILKHCDNLVKVEMLYHVRRKLLDLARSRTGNIFLQELIEKLPAVQKREIAETFVLNVDEGELADLCRHEYGNHVAQKLLEFPASAEMIEERLLMSLESLASDNYGQRVVAKYISSVVGGAAQAVQTLLGCSDDDEVLGDKVEAMIDGSSESYVLCALLKAIDVPSRVKDAIVAAIAGCCDDLVLGNQRKDKSHKKGDRFADSAEDYDDAVPDFAKPQVAASSGKEVAVGETTKAQQPRHIHTIIAAIESGDDAQREMLVDALHPHFALMLQTKGLVDVAIAVLRFGGADRQSELLRMFFGSVPANTTLPLDGSAKKKGKTPKKESPQDATPPSVAASSLAMDPIKTLFFRAVADLPDSLVRIPKSAIADLIRNVATIAVSPVGSPVAQRLLATADEATNSAFLAAAMPSLEKLNGDPVGVFLVQSFLDHLKEDKREALATQIVTGFIPEMLTKLASNHGSRLLQKALAFASNDAIKDLVKTFVEQSREHEEDEVEEPEEVPQVDANGKRLSTRQIQAISRNRHYAIRRMTVVDFALHHTACYAVQAMLRECRGRQLLDERRLLMNELKKNVYELAVSPWAGRVVLDTMLTIASKELSEAIRNVVFLRVESWLSEAPASASQKGSADPTMRKAVQRRRDDSGDSGEKDSKKTRVEKPQDSAAPSSTAEKPKKQKKLFRSMKK
jgi:hypothetical protein